MRGPLHLREGMRGADNIGQDAAASAANDNVVLAAQDGLHDADDSAHNGLHDDSRGSTTRIQEVDRRAGISSVTFGPRPGSASATAQDEMHPRIPLPGQADEASLRLCDNSASLPKGQSKLMTFGEAAAGTSKNAPERRVVEGRMSEFGDNASLVEAEEDISHEQLQMIKARTMFQMTEEIADDAGGGRKRLLFLTNSQADFLASSGASLQSLMRLRSQNLSSSSICSPRRGLPITAPMPCMVASRTMAWRKQALCRTEGHF